MPKTRAKPRKKKATQYAIVAAAAKRHGVPPWLLWGIYGAESTYGTDGDNYFGLIEPYYMMANGQKRVPHNTANLPESADIAAELLATLKKEHGSWAGAVAQYAPYEIGHPKELSTGGKEQASQFVDLELPGPLPTIPFPGPNINPAQPLKEGAEAAGNAAGNALGLGDIASTIKDVGRLLFTPEGWLQVGQVFAGIALVGWGAAHLVKASTGTDVVRKATGLSAKAAEIAAVVK